MSETVTPISPEKVMPALHEWFKLRRWKQVKAKRFGFSEDEIGIGDLCVVATDHAVYLCYKSSQNYYQSGNTIIPVGANCTAYLLKEYPCEK